MFYNSFAKSIISYGILTYGSAAKSNLYKSEKAQRRILRAIFFRNKYNSVGFNFERNKISTVFEIYLMELFAEVFKQLRTESPLSSLNKAGNHSYYTRRNKKGLLSIPYSRTVTEVSKETIQNILFNLGISKSRGLYKFSSVLFRETTVKTSFSKNSSKL